MRRRLKLLRVSKGYTQAEMAFICGVSRTAYCNIEKGKSNGSMKFWLAVQDMFPEVDISELAEREVTYEQAKNRS